MMDIPIIFTCAATLADILDRYPLDRRPPYEKLWPRDPRGSYGEYIVWLSAREAATILRQRPGISRLA